MSRNRTVVIVAGLCCVLALVASGDAASPSGVPPANHLLVSPDSRYVYRQHVEYNPDGSVWSDVVEVYGHDGSGRATEVQCLAGVNAAAAPAGCDRVLPPGLETMQMTHDGTAIYLAGHRSQVGPLIGMLARLRRDAATGRLKVTDCLAGAAHPDQPGCRTNPLLKSRPRLLVVARDVYAYTRGKLISLRPDPATGKLTQVGVIPPPGLVELRASPDGRRVYATDRQGALITLFRHPRTGVVD